jgi:hypothetical protein
MLYDWLYACIVDHDQDKSNGGEKFIIKFLENLWIMSLSLCATAKSAGPLETMGGKRNCRAPLPPNTHKK